MSNEPNVQYNTDVWRRAIAKALQKGLQKMWILSRNLRQGMGKRSTLEMSIWARTEKARQFKQVAEIKEWSVIGIKEQGLTPRGSCFILGGVFFLYHWLLWGSHKSLESLPPQNKKCIYNIAYNLKSSQFPWTPSWKQITLKRIE
jgi:hypothetical protein